MALAEKLIELVKKYPILYDLSHEDYKNTKKKDKVWEAIGAELNEDTDDMKKKWKNLRDTFLRYIKGKRTKNKNKKWHWAAQMEAFNPSLTFESKTPNSSKIQSKTPNADQIPDECSQMEPTEDSNLDPIATECVETSFNDSVFVDYRKTSESASGHDSASFSTSTLSRKRKLKNEFRLTSSVESLIKYLKSQKQPELDETDLLFLAYARNIKTFSKKRQAIAKMKVSQVIMEQEIQNLEDQSPTIQNPDDYYRSLACSSTSVSRSRPNSPYRELHNFQDLKPCRDV